MCVCLDSVCESGQWSCTETNCPGICSVKGGAHVNTFDGKVYTFHGDCSYVLAKVILTASPSPHTHNSSILNRMHHQKIIC